MHNTVFIIKETKIEILCKDLKAIQSQTNSKETEIEMLVDHL
jgi:hypothetical protein